MVSMRGVNKVWTRVDRVVNSLKYSAVKGTTQFMLSSDSVKLGTTQFMLSSNFVTKPLLMFTLSRQFVLLRPTQ